MDEKVEPAASQSIGDLMVYPLSNVKQEAVFKSRKDTTTLVPRDPRHVKHGTMDTLMTSWIKQEPTLPDSCDITNLSKPMHQNDDKCTMPMKSEQGNHHIPALLVNSLKSEPGHEFDRDEVKPSFSADCLASHRYRSSNDNEVIHDTWNFPVPVALFKHDTTPEGGVSVKKTERDEGETPEGVLELRRTEDFNDIKLRGTQQREESAVRVQTIAREVTKDCILEGNTGSDNRSNQQQSWDLIQETAVTCEIIPYNSEIVPLNSGIVPHVKKMKTSTSDQLHKCIYCDYKSSFLSDMVRHATDHTGDKPYTCSKCDYQTEHKGNLNDQQQRMPPQCDHETEDGLSLVIPLRANTEGKPCTYKCVFCQYRSGNKHAFLAHRRTHTVKEKLLLYPCTLCYDRFATQDDLIAHQFSDHAQQKPYGCSICDYRTVYRSQLARHLRMHTRGELYSNLNLVTRLRANTENKPCVYKCLYCKYRSDDEDAFFCHWRTHTGDKKLYSCSLCDDRFETQDDLIAHQYSDHRLTKTYGCSMCDYRSIYKANLSRHMRTHTGEEPCNRDMCGSADERGLEKKRTRTEKIEKPYKCSHCPCTCPDKSALLIHRTNHTGEKPYRCPLCVYRTGKKSGLKTHITQTHSEERQYKCLRCDYRAKNKDHLERHTRTHKHVKNIPDQPYKCIFCEYETYFMKDMVRHASSHA